MPQNIIIPYSGSIIIHVYNKIQQIQPIFVPPPIKKKCDHEEQHSRIEAKLDNIVDVLSIKSDHSTPSQLLTQLPAAPPQMPVVPPQCQQRHLTP